MSLSREPNRTETLPNGTEVRFWDSVGVDGKGQRRAYRVDGRDEVWPSVSTVAGIYAIPALTPKAAKMTEEAVIALAQEGVDIASLTQPELRRMCQQRGTHYDTIWGVARERGDLAHDMLVKLVSEEEEPSRADYPPDMWEWIRAGVEWVRDEDPEVVDAEYFVASTTYQFAGRGDLLCVPRKGPRKGKLVRVDYKTVSAWSYKPLLKGEDPPGRLQPPWDENLIALAGYELAAVESGYQPSDVRLIVRLGPDGKYDPTESHATEKVFLAALTAHREKGYLTKPRPEAVAS
jgi:hypothetical protein